VCAQLSDRKNGHPRETPPIPGDPLGIPPSEVHLALQTDVCKELVNKIAWTLGSVYRRSYSNMRSPARAYAWRIVKQVIEDNGYPDKIAK